MPDLWMDVDAALAEVPVNVLPLIDDTDFKSIEGAVAFNAAGMALRWHFVTTAGAYTVTSVTPTSGGDYDWTDQGDSGVYTIEIPASGGASINNDTEGFGWFTGVATGVLPWRGPTIGFRAAATNNSLVDSTFDKTGYTIAVGGIGATAFAAGAIDASAIAADAIGASELAQAAAQEVADEVLNRDLAGGGSGNTRNVRNALRALRNKVSIAAGTATICQEDDSTAAWTAAVTTAAGNPISGVDPA
jgi:hypothetical protein